MPHVPDAVPGALRTELRELIKVMRMLRQQEAYQESAVPAGLAGLLAEIAQASQADPAVNGCHVKDLAARCGLDPSTVSRAVSSLVGSGLVERHADPADRRASVLTLTGAGRAALDAKHEWYGRLFGQALGHWSTEDLQTLVGYLRRFTTDLSDCLGTAVPQPRTGTTSDSTASMEAAR